MKILVGSKSELKVGGVVDAMKVGVRLEVHSRSTRSLINEQPVGYEEIFQGAWNRMNQILQVPGYDYYVVIENGIVMQPNYFDVGCVLIQDNALNLATAYTAAVYFPAEYVEEARRRGFETTTAGMIIAENLGGDDGDPHFTLTGVSRRELIRQAVEVCFGQLYKKSLLRR